MANKDLEKILRKYDECGKFFFDGLAWVRLNGKWGYIDQTGKEVIPCKYEACGDFHKGLAWVELNGKCGYIDKTGKEVIPCKYGVCGDFHEGLAAVKLNGKWGYIDKTGKEVIPCKYGVCGDFHEGLAAVKLNGKWGYIDKTGKEVIPCKYGICGQFCEGLAWIEQNDSDLYVDKTGREYSKQTVNVNEKTIVDEKVLADDEELKKLKEDIIAIAKARIGALNGEEENFKERSSEIIERTNKIIENIMTQKAKYDKKVSKNKTKKGRIEEIESKAIDSVDELPAETKETTSD